MSAPRIGDAELRASEGSVEKDDERLVTRIGAALGSPVGVLLVVPGLVLFIGVLLTAIGQDALRRSSLALGREQVSAQNAIVARQIGVALAKSDVILERLRTLAETHSPSAPFDGVAFALRDLMQGRAGVAYVSLSFPDGTFQGAYTHEDGSIRFQDSRVEANGTRVRRFATDGRKALSLLVEERSTYDPRTRDFYRLALASPRAAWTKPYPFFKTHYTGITRTQAVRGPTGAVLAVLTVDFDVNELSRFLERIPLAGSRVVLYANDGTLLGDPVDAARIQALPVRADRALHYRDLADPVLDALFASGSAGGSGAFSAGDRRFVVNRANVGDAALGWQVASFVPESVLFEPARAYQRRAALLALLALLVAAGVAISFSRHVVRMRRQTAEARAAASRAAAQARDLGSYRLTHRLGVGGMGEVWCAEHRLLAREAAIKLIRSESAPGVDAQERFRREAQTLAALRSRNTIELFDYGVADDGTFFYVMELLDGMDLETLVTRHGPQSPARVQSLLMQACSSLAEAHAAGLVHRDIKPANLYICRAADEVDVLKVLDFGLVRSLADEAQSPEGRSLEDLARELESEVQPLSKLTAAGAIMGTPEYMAPEQILGVETDGRTDIYALGCVAHFVLSGELAFPSKSDPMQTMLAHLQNDPPSLAGRVRGGSGDALASIVVRCMARRAEDRPPSVSALRRELAALTFAEEETWTEDRASDWWDQHVPRRSSLRPVAGPLAPKVSLRAPGEGLAG
ncbi:MAG TPA: serine/threonine protein kinase [Polyangiaceae bacterium]